MGVFPRQLQRNYQSLLTKIQKMETVAVKDIPQNLLGSNLKEQLLGEHNLKHTEAAEKNVLPSAEDVKSEKNHLNILTGIEAFKCDNLKHTETQEKIILPGAEEIQTEKNIQGLLQGVAGFENDKLRTVKTREPASPSSILQTELARDSSLTAVSDFDKATLKKAETAEKNPLPSTEAIAQEMEHIKFKVGIEKFDKTKLSHTDTLVKNILPTQEVIALEKSQ